MRVYVDVVVSYIVLNCISQTTYILLHCKQRLKT